MSQVSYLFHFGFLGWVHTTFLQEISADYGALTTFFRRFSRSLRNARLTAIKYSPDNMISEYDDHEYDLKR